MLISQDSVQQRVPPPPSTLPQAAASWRPQAAQQVPGLFASLVYGTREQLCPRRHQQMSFCSAAQDALSPALRDSTHPPCVPQLLLSVGASCLPKVTPAQMGKVTKSCPKGFTLTTRGGKDA
jgi:hypothetical protein